LSETSNMLITNSHLQWVLLSAWNCLSLLVMLSTLGYEHYQLFCFLIIQELIHRH